MRLALVFLCLLPAAAWAGGNTSVTTAFDLEKTCRMVEKGDGLVSAGTWSCPGHGGEQILITLWDEHSYVGFGLSAADSCAYARTFEEANTALSPVEWRLAKGKAIAAIQVWRVFTGGAGASTDFQVVTALKGKQACPIHYVEGSGAEAAEKARQAADRLAEGFDCDEDVPTVEPGADADVVSLISCAEMTDQ
jgi:hypothetical protein